MVGYARKCPTLHNHDSLTTGSHNATPFPLAKQTTYREERGATHFRDLLTRNRERDLNATVTAPSGAVGEAQ